MEGSACNPDNTVLLLASNQLHSDCGYTTWCDDVDKTCKPRGCRRDEYPFGFNRIPHSEWPPRCDSRQFCPDEGSFCMNKVDVGKPCQLDRDDQCATTTRTPNVKCLHSICTAVNATQGSSCIYENTIYTFFTKTNTTAGTIISRDNCIDETYCDAPTTKCMPRKATGASCTADKECLTGYCLDPSFVLGVPVNNDATGKCSDPPFHMAHRHQVWVYPVASLVTLALFGVVIAIVARVHHLRSIARHRAEKEYWESQRAISRRAQAVRNTIVSLSDRSTAPVQEDFVMEDLRTGSARLSRQSQDLPSLYSPRSPPMSPAAFHQDGTLADVATATGTEARVGREPTRRGAIRPMGATEESTSIPLLLTSRAE